MECGVDESPVFNAEVKNMYQHSVPTLYQHTVPLRLQAHSWSGASVNIEKTLSFLILNKGNGKLMLYL
jgi:hypothetical protein